MHEHSPYGVPGGQEGEKEPEKTFEEIIAENFPNMEKEIVNQEEEHVATDSNQTDKN